MEKGLMFSVATGRSLSTALRGVHGLALPHPLIYNNGVFVGCAAGHRLRETCFPGETARLALDLLIRHGIYPLAHAMLAGAERTSYMPSLATPELMAFLGRSRLAGGDPRRREVDRPEELYAGRVFYLVCPGAADRLEPAWKELLAGPPGLFQVYFSNSIYTGSTFLEVLPGEATKGAAARFLKERLGCSRLVSFGDAVNDIPLFEASDESYATAEAPPLVQAAATAVIGSHREDAVARWMADHALASC